MGGEDAGADGDGFGAGIDDGKDVIVVDAADGEERQFGVFRGGAHEREAGDGGALGAGVEDGANAEVVCAGRLGGEEFLEVVSGGADDRFGAEDFARGGNGEVAAADVDAIGAGQERNFGTVIDDEDYVTGEVAAESGALEEDGVGEFFFAQLDAVGAAGDDFRNDFLEGERRYAVRDEDREPDR